MKDGKGFTLIEAVVGLLISSLVLAAALALWNTHQTEGTRLAKKIELRNRLTLASKRLQRSVTLAGIGLDGAASLAKADAVPSDTLTLYTNPEERSTLLSADADHHVAAIQVDDPSLFAAGGYVALVGGGHAELRRVEGIQGPILTLDSPFANDYAVAVARVMPAWRERFYSDRQHPRFLRETAQGVQEVASDVKNFQVAFLDRHGESTEDAGKVRSVRFSLTGVFPARKGAIDNIEFSSTAIPRNSI